MATEAASYYEELTSFPEKDRQPIPTNEFGIVLPPSIIKCIGEACKFRRGRDECIPNKHHLHSTLPFYQKAGDIALKFRELNILTVWMPECQHDIHHDMHELDVEAPATDIMRGAKDEAKKLDKVIQNYSELRNINYTLSERVLNLRQRRGLTKRRETLLNRREELAPSVNAIVIIPEELVTGALLLTAPKIARDRMSKGSKTALTGTIPKKDIALAERLARRNLLDAKIHEATEEWEELEVA